MAQYDYDLIVLGGGSGGVSLARRAASYGAKVALLEPDRLGGTCVHRGCVPKKLLAYAAAFPYNFKVASGYGFTIPPVEFSWADLVAAKNKELDRLLGFYVGSVEKSGVEHISARGKLKGPHEVELDGHPGISGRYICIAVGGKAFRPEIPGTEHSLISDDMFRLPKFPKHCVIQGSGYIGLEFASIMQGLGSQVEVVFRSGLPLPGFDGDVRRCVKEEMELRGVSFRPGTHVQKIEKSSEGFVVHTDQGLIATEVFLCATGRVPNTANLGLEAVGIAADKTGAILINNLRETSVSGVFALGDCTGKIQLTPYAIAEGRGLADRVFGQKSPVELPTLIPTAVFSQPAVGTVGSTEEEARKAWGDDDVEIYRTRFRPMRFTLPDLPEKVLMKLVVRRSTQLVVGAHMVGEDAPEIIQALSVALTCGATKAQFDQTLALHPTVGEEFVLLREPVAATPERS